VNILFVNYGDLSSNSINHIAPFASRLTALGNSCIVAVPAGSSEAVSLQEPGLVATTYDNYLKGLVFFPDGKPADIIHAWTPRDNVRSFVLACLKKASARLIVHLEDNEEHLSCSYLGVDPAQRFSEQALSKADLSPDCLSHPSRHRFFLRSADAITVITPSLREMAPRGIPCIELPPGIDNRRFFPRPQSAGLRASLGLQEGEKIIVFSGSNTFANEAEVRDLYGAVALLNARGVAVRLLRTGHYSSKFTPPLAAHLLTHVTDLGFVDKTRIPELLSLADLVVQPGHPGPFNNYRLPSKIPEVLSMGLPLILPAANAGLELKDGEEALLLKKGSAEEIAGLCVRIFSDNDLAQSLSRGGLAFAKRRYDLDTNTEALVALYRTTLGQAPRAGSASSLAGDESDIGLWLRQFGSGLTDKDTREVFLELVPYLEHFERNREALADLAGLRLKLSHIEEALKGARTHAFNIQAAAQTRDELTSQHVRNLENIINHFKEQNRSLNRQLDELVTATAQDRRKLQAELKALIAAKEDKIARMQKSFSWKITSPLRLLRRAFTALRPKKSRGGVG
jgi:glycosyltransferase involved in cell wall biosynthesis